MRIRLLAAAAALAAAPVFAAIAPGGTQTGFSGNGELFLSVFDDITKNSFTFDFGVTMSQFTGLVASGGTVERDVTGQTWTSFRGLVGSNPLQWSILAIDSTGGTAAGGIRLFATVNAADVGRIGTMTNNLLTLGLGAAQAGTFFDAVNLTGTHGVSGQAPNYALNGASVNNDADSGNAYYGTGSPGLSPSLNGNAPFSMASAVGAAAPFYLVQRSSTTQLDTVTGLLFQAPGSLPYVATFDGTVATLAPIPEPGTYAMLLAGLAAVGFVASRRRG